MTAHPSKQLVPSAAWSIALAALIAMTSLGVTGCASTPPSETAGPTTSEEGTMPEDAPTVLLDEAEANEALVRARLQEAKQLMVGDDAQGWSEVTELELMPCGDTEYSYVTRLSYGNTDGWRFPEGVTEFRETVGQRFVDAGWGDITGSNIDDGNAYSMTASWPGEVRELLVMFHPGDVADGFTVYLESACWPGTVNEIWKLQKEKYSGS